MHSAGYDLGIFEAVQLFVTPSVKAVTLLWSLTPLAMLPLASSWVVLTLSILAEPFLSSQDHLWTTKFHYSAPSGLFYFWPRSTV